MQQCAIEEIISCQIEFTRVSDVKEELDIQTSELSKALNKSITAELERRAVIDNEDIMASPCLHSAFGSTAEIVKNCLDAKKESYGRKIRSGVEDDPKIILWFNIRIENTMIICEFTDNIFGFGDDFVDSKLISYSQKLTPLSSQTADAAAPLIEPSPSKKLGIPGLLGGNNLGLARILRYVAGNPEIGHAGYGGDLYIGNSPITNGAVIQIFHPLGIKVPHIRQKELGADFAVYCASESGVSRVCRVLTATQPALAQLNVAAKMAEMRKRAEAARACKK